MARFYLYRYYGCVEVFTPMVLKKLQLHEDITRGLYIKGPGNLVRNINPCGLNLKIIFRAEIIQFAPRKLNICLPH